MAARRLSITRAELLAAARRGQTRQLVQTALKRVGLDDCSDCAQRLLKNIDRLMPLILNQQREGRRR